MSSYTRTRFNVLLCTIGLNAWLSLYCPDLFIFVNSIYSPVFCISFICYVVIFLYVSSVYTLQFEFTSTQGENRTEPGYFESTYPNNGNLYRMTRIGSIKTLVFLIITRSIISRAGVSKCIRPWTWRLYMMAENNNYYYNTIHVRI
jgi:hypothetical protein